MVRPLILVTMGTNDYPFTRLQRAIECEPLYRDPRCEWFVQTGVTKVTSTPACGVVEQLIPRADMEDLVRRSALVISHCGIGSLNLMLQYQKRVIFMPRVSSQGEFSDDHQLQIANEISSRKITVVYPEDDFPGLVYQQLVDEELLFEPVDITNYDLANVVNHKLTD